MQPIECRIPKPVTTLEELEKVAEFLLVFAAYLVIEHEESVHRVVGHRLDTAIDRAIPFFAPSVFVYAMLWVFALAPLAYVRSNTYFRPLFASMAATLVCSYAIFLVFPTKMILQPSLEGTPGFAAWLVRGIYADDGPYNCFPSVHVALSHLSAWSLLVMDRVVGRVAWVIAALITLSTLFLKQHYLADVVAGAAIGFAAHRFGLGRYARACPPDAGDRRDRSVLWALVALQGAGMIALFATYLFRATP